MAEMDILMPTHTDAPTSQSHHHPQPPSGGCPYFRPDPGHHSHNFAHQPHPHHSLPHPLPHPHLHNNSHTLPGLLSSAGRGGSLGHSQQSPHSQFPHTNYDPVHAGSGSPWFSAPSPPFPWPSAGSVSLPPHPHSHPHPHPHSQSSQHSHPHSHPQLPQLSQSRPGPGPGPSSSSEPPYLAGVGGGPLPAHSAGAPGTGPGPIQPGLLSSPHHFPPPHHDPFIGGASTYNQFAFRQPPALHHNHRFSTVPSLGQAGSSQEANHQTQQQSQQQQHHHQGLPHQQPHNRQSAPPQQQQQQHHHHHTHQQQQQQQMSLAGDRSLAPQPSSTAPHGVSLNPPPPALPVPAAAAPPPNMSSTSVEPSPDAHHPPFRQSLYRVSPPPPPPPPASASDPPRPTPFGGPESSRTSSSSAASSDPEVYPLSALPVNSERRRDYTARMRLGRAHPPSDYDSDEDPSDMMETESETLSFLEQFSVGNMAFHGRDEEMRIRTQQMIRGQLTNKRVASKKAINQLQSVDISTLDESERSCVICYNEFGVPNPEGINEAPLRLPNCKHVFGDHCIKKWFEESDSCPYCRDKVPSEPVLTSNTRALHQIIQSYANNPRYAVASGRALADPALARMMAQREEARMMQREEARMAQREEARFEGSPPRTWQTGERRSPPSEASETRRRTRARHGSFRGSPATNTANSRPNLHGGMNPTAPLQQSPARERVNAPYQPHWGYLSGARLLTAPPTGRQFMHMPSNHRLYGYSGVVRAPGMPPVEPFGLAPPSMPPSQMPYNPLLSPVEDQRFQNSLNGGSGPPVPAEPAQLPGPSHMTTFSQQLPPVGTLEPPSFPSTSSTANGHSNAAGDWMQ